MASQINNMLRALAQRVAFAARAQNRDAISEAQQACIQQVLDVDLGLVDRDSDAYRVGGIEILEAVLTNLESQTLSNDTVRLLHKSGRARLINAVMAWSGLSQRQLAERLGLRTSNLNTYLRELAQDDLIEPAPIKDGQRGRSYRITPWGKIAWQRIVDGTIGVKLPKNEVADALTVAGNAVERLAQSSIGKQELEKQEFYEHLRCALKVTSRHEILFSSLLPPDLNAPKSSTQFYIDALELVKNLKRPLKWLFVNDPASREYANQLMENAGKQKKLFCPYFIEKKKDDLYITCQVTENEGLFYPYRKDKAEKTDPATGRKEWDALYELCVPST